MSTDTCLRWLLIVGVFCACSFFGILHFKLYLFSPLFYKDYAVKKQRWDEKALEVSSWGDALGLGIDAGIKDTVIVLNLLGFTTQQSCEGHLNHGRPYPWVSFVIDDAELEVPRKKWEDLEDAVTAAETAIIAKHPELPAREALRIGPRDELEKLYQEARVASEKMNTYRKMKMAPINDLLQVFYGNCAHPDTMIAREGVNEIASIGGYWQMVRDDANKAIKLKEYQTEMRRFTDFLIDRYYRK
jgi:hypothetical protein